MFFKKKKTGTGKVKVPYEDTDYSTFNCVGIHKERQFMAYVTGADPWDHELKMPKFPNPSDDNWENEKRWYGVLHLFDLSGNHTQTLTFLGGSSADGKQTANEKAFNELNQVIMSMQKPRYCDIFINPFKHEEDGYMFGLLKEEESNDYTLYPNDIMFHEPFDGEYST